MKKIIASVIVLALFTTGCTGSFNLTRKVYNFHRSQSDKWADELCFLLVAIFPVYSLASFADAIVFNSIEFWSGNNPIGMSSTGSENRIVQNGKEKVMMTYNPQTDQVHVAKAGNKGVILEHNDKGITAKNDKGEVLYSSTSNQNGDVTIYNAKGEKIKEYPAGQIAMLKEKYLQQE